MVYDLWFTWYRLRGGCLTASQVVPSEDERRDSTGKASLSAATHSREKVGLRPLANDVIEVLFARVDEPYASPSFMEVTWVVCLVLCARAA